MAAWQITTNSVIVICNSVSQKSRYGKLSRVLCSRSYNAIPKISVRLLSYQMLAWEKICFQDPRSSFPSGHRTHSCLLLWDKRQSLFAGGGQPIFQGLSLIRSCSLRIISNLIKVLFFLRILFIYLTQREKAHRQGKREKEKQAPHWARSLMQGSIPGPQDHDLSQRQMFNQLSHPGTPIFYILNKIMSCFVFYSALAFYSTLCFWDVPVMIHVTLHHTSQQLL